MCPSTHRHQPPPHAGAARGARGARAIGLAALALATLGARGAHAEPCSLHKAAELAVTMEDLVPTVHAKVNGKDAVFVADSGAFFSSVTPSAADMFHLSRSYLGTVMGVGGTTQAWLTRVDMFTIFDVDLPKVPFIVVGNDLGPGIVGLLGQNVFRIGDVVEYDLANGAIRMLRTKGDCNKASLAYWANAKSENYSVIPIEFATREEPHTKAEVFVNGQRVRVIFDSGAAVSVLTPEAARHAGVGPATPGFKDAGISEGIGTRVTHTAIAPFNSFKIGDEEVQHTRLRIGEVGLPSIDMLIGADFFLSHHILVATSQRKLYFTYNGGPVFNLTVAPTSGAAADASAAAPAEAGAVAGEQLDAAGYARRGAAETSRHDYRQAILDLTHACELAPTEADYFYERGMAYWDNKQGEPALADFDQAIKLRPNYAAALLARAGLHAAQDARSEVIIADLDAASRAVPSNDASRLALGELYQSAGNATASIAEFTKFIDSHNRDEVELAEAFNGRCWTRALAGRELEQALDDCDRAVRRRRDDASYYDSRGLVHLRMGHYDKAIGDYDAALRLNPKIAWSLYGRGIAKVRKGDVAGGQADIAAAAALDADIAEDAARYDIKP
jgi:tetratricopeptide (TPR) repeat protein/predicted aspartyl protease